ncbi:MAG: hypothetical protein Fur006_10200 [Coleofasciculaceae cyanobacterium]
MENIEQYKTILEILVIILGLAQPYPLLAIAAGLGTIYYLVQSKDEKKDKKDDNTEQ